MRVFTFKGFMTAVGVNPLCTHHMKDIWPEPDRFDPLRFTEEGQRDRHRFAWIRSAAAARICASAYMQAECFARHFLQNLEVSLEPNYKPDWQMWPIRNRATDFGW
jgi:cytochrome P450